MSLVRTAWQEFGFYVIPYCLEHYSNCTLCIAIHIPETYSASILRVEEKATWHGEGNERTRAEREQNRGLGGKDSGPKMREILIFAMLIPGYQTTRYHSL